MSMWLGVGLALCSTVCSASGYTLQKIAHNRFDKAAQAAAAAALLAPTITTAADAAEVFTPSANSTPAARVLDRSGVSATHAHPPALAVSNGVRARAVVPADAVADAVADASSPAPSPSSSSASDDPLSARPSPSPTVSSSEVSVTVAVAAAAAVKLGGSEKTGTSPRVKPYTHYWQFPAGLGLLIAGTVFAAFVFGLAPQSTLAPLGSVTMILNSLFAWRFLGERFTGVDAASVVLMAAGTTLAVLFGKGSDPKYTLDTVVHLFVDRPAAWALALSSATAMSLAASYVYTVGSRTVEQLSPAARSADVVCRAFLGAAWSGYSNFASKAVVEVAFASVSDRSGRDWTRLPMYLLIAVMVLSLVMQVKFLNLGLAKYDAMVVVRLYQAMLAIFSILSGFFYFNELAAQTRTSVVMFCVGVVIVLSGIVVGMLRRQIVPVTAGAAGTGAAATGAAGAAAAAPFGGVAAGDAATSPAPQAQQGFVALPGGCASDEYPTSVPAAASEGGLRSTACGATAGARSFVDSATPLLQGGAVQLVSYTPGTALASTGPQAV